ncbi:hypothetical protein HPC49_03015 [Pyxidicoccus fallax]|uniref:Lipoprotein n=1 Tax=Pyxidicoccus fallax TaxID=394095 RepID=A0A848L9D5_9BACT|nr:hypothetical protein [Pyxidicoccus fallax]NMO15630.1 hypothetical protein [Pyxidicoccus fallax]NPC77227.1 hypothetical protein [Pyxidicoccus fallax]
MNSFKTCSLAVVTLALGACGPAPEGKEQAPSGAELAQAEAAVTRPIPNTTCVVEATSPYTYDNVTVSAQASVWDCDQDYPIIYICSIVELRSVSSTGTVTWTALPGSRSCWPETNTDFGGQTANRVTYTPGSVYRQRAQAAIKLNATTWTPAQPSSCTTLANDIPCTFTSVVSAGVTIR